MSNLPIKSTSAISTLYAPTPRPKSKPIPISHSSIHSLSTELQIAKEARKNKTTGSFSGRAETLKRKRGDDSGLGGRGNRGVEGRMRRDLKLDGLGGGNGKGGKGGAGQGMGLTEAELDRSRKKMEEKSLLYEKLRRGEASSGVGVGGGEGGQGKEKEFAGSLIDFDRKWAEGEEGSDAEPSDDDSSPTSDDDEGDSKDIPDADKVEYTDEFGRTRLVTRAFLLKHHQDNPSTPPTPNPTNVIHGPLIQTHAITTNSLSGLYSSNPNSMIPVLEDSSDHIQETHYDASAEIRTKGVGFYTFSGDNEQRKREMEELEAERKRTEEERKKKEEERRRKREVVERRREEVRRRRREVVGKKWLEGFWGEMEIGRGGKEKEEAGVEVEIEEKGKD